MTTDNGKPTTNDIENVIIIGSGPSGYTAALYTARANLHPLLLAGGVDPATSRTKGGQLMATSDIENFPGAIAVTDDIYAMTPDDVKGITGPELMQRMELQARHAGARIEEEFVTEVDVCSNAGEYYTLTTESGKEYRARTIIISTGASAKRLNIPAEEKFFGKGGGVSTCATCDGFLFSNMKATVAVVGGGDSAMEEATYLARLEGIPKVYIIHRREEFRASQVMLQRAQSNPKIEFKLNRQVIDIKGKPHPLAEQIPGLYKDQEVIAAAVLQDTQNPDAAPEELPIDGLFIAIGHTPNTELFKGQLQMDDAGYLTHDGRMRALPSATCSHPKMRGFEHVPGVFVAGDVSDHIYRQAVTAAGMGCMAAIEAERYLAEKLAELKHLDAEAVDISNESIAQSHWSTERDEMGEKPIIERVAEAETVAG